MTKLQTPHPHAHRHGPVYRAMMRYSRTLHTYFSMLAIILFVFFASTGFMLNHPTWFRLDGTRRTESDVTIPANIISAKDKLALVEYLRTQGVTGAVDRFDWPDEGEPFHVSFKSPKSECDADITLPSGETHLTIDTYGVLGLITRLHTAREAGPVWQLFLDATAILLLLVCFTGLILWQSLPKRRMLGSAGIILSVAAVVLAYCLCVP